MSLLGGAKSDLAARLVDRLLDGVVLPYRDAAGGNNGTALRASSRLKFRAAIGALLADLMDIQRKPAGVVDGVWQRAGTHGLAKRDFNAAVLGFGCDIFKPVVEALGGAGLLSVTKGAPSWRKVFDSPVNIGGKVSSFHLTPKFLALAEGHGVRLDDWPDHWRRSSGRLGTGDLSLPSIELRGTKPKRNGRATGRAPDLLISPDDAEAARISAQTDQLNHCLSGRSLGEMAFSGLRRIFSRGDDPSFAWNMGGRHYPMAGGHNYVGWPSHRRMEAIRLDGEAVDEADLRASHLTLYHALLGEAFDASDDPYAVDDWPRAVVKAWISQALGSTNPRPFQWSKDAQAAFEAERPDLFMLDQFPIREVGAAVTQKHPLLIDLRFSGISTLHLQFHESEILRLAMEDLLLRQNITVLPMHDALVVPQSKFPAAAKALTVAFSSYVEAVTGKPCMVKPMVTSKAAEGA